MESASWVQVLSHPKAVASGQWPCKAPQYFRGGLTQGGGEMMLHRWSFAAAAGIAMALLFARGATAAPGEAVFSLNPGDRIGQLRPGISGESSPRTHDALGATAAGGSSFVEVAGRKRFRRRLSGRQAEFQSRMHVQRRRGSRFPRRSRQRRNASVHPRRRRQRRRPPVHYEPVLPLPALTNPYRVAGAFAPFSIASV